MKTTGESTELEFVESHKLHIYRPPDQNFVVWLNTEVAKFDGLCVGVGETRQAAIADAITVFQEATKALKEQL